MAFVVLLGLIAVFMTVLVVMLAAPLRRAHLRTAERTASQKDLIEKMSLAQNAPGGSELNPIVISTPVLVESQAEGARCPRCDTQMRLEEHAAKIVEGRSLRVAKLKCPRCEAEREIFFELLRPS